MWQDRPDVEDAAIGFVGGGLGRGELVLGAAAFLGAVRGRHLARENGRGAKREGGGMKGGW